MSSPRLEPWFIPETISSGRSTTSPSSAKRTQSTGVPSVAYPIDPSSNGSPSTQSGERVVMLRAVALRLESGAITWTSSSGILRSSTRRAFSPAAWIPSSLVIRTFIRPPILRSSISAGLSARLGRGRLGRSGLVGLTLAPSTQLVQQVDPGEAAAVDDRGERRRNLQQLAAGRLGELVDAAIDEVRGEGDHQHAGGGEELAQVEFQGAAVERDAERDCGEQAEDPACNGDHGAGVLGRRKEEERGLEPLACDGDERHRCQ